MSKKVVDHFDPGPLGAYRGHSVQNDDGTIDTFENTGSIIPGEVYVGTSKVRREFGSGTESKGGGGGGGGSGPADGMILILMSPIFLLLGIIALCVCPGLWLLYRAVRKKPEVDPNAPPKCVGGGWVALSMFMLVASLGAVGDMLKWLPPALEPGSHSHLVIPAIAASWAGSLVLGAIDILRRNRASTILGVFLFLVALEAFGMFVVFKNSRDVRYLREVLFGGSTSKSGPDKTSAGPANVMQIARVSRVTPRQMQTITIRGSGFGVRPAYAGDSGAIRIRDFTRNWNAGWANDPGGDKITLSVTSWTDTRIVITGFGGAYGGDQNSLHAGDKLSFQVWNAQSGVGPAVFNALAAPD